MGTLFLLLLTAACSQVQATAKGNLDGQPSQPTPDILPAQHYIGCCSEFTATCQACILGIAEDAYCVTVGTWVPGCEIWCPVRPEIPGCPCENSGPHSSHCSAWRNYCYHPTVKENCRKMCGLCRPQYMIGRPYTSSESEDGIFTSEAAECPTTTWNKDADTVDVPSWLSAEQRAVVAEAWTTNGLGEHASVASFSRFTIELMALQAPASLLAKAQKAALEEANHAELSFEIASAFKGSPVGPGEFPAHSMSITNDLGTLIKNVFSEGVVGESVASIVAGYKARAASEGRVKAVLEQITEEEARHAQLAIDTLRWALSVDPSLRDQLLAAMPRTSEVTASPAFLGPMSEFGVLSREAESWISNHALHHVVLPRVWALFGGVEASRSALNTTLLSTSATVFVAAESV